MLGIQVGSGVLGIGASVPSGVSAAILIGGTNDMATAQNMGARWEVRDPDGVVVDSYEDWEMFWTGPGLEQGFVGNQFILDKLGLYTVKADLLMNPAAPVTVDSYDGALCAVTEAAPTEELIQHTIYPFAYIYEGDQETTTASFRTDPFVPSAWLAEIFAGKLDEEVRAQGGRPLEVKVYVDVTPIFWTDFTIEVISTPIGGVAGVSSGTAVGVPIWLAIILVCLAITAVIVAVTLAITTVVGLVKRKPGLHEMKPAWGKETLILTIKDSEDYWERTPTPSGDLEGMSEAALRDYLDEIADEEVGEGLDWAAMAIIGGAGVLAAGAIAAFAMTRPKE